METVGIPSFLTHLKKKNQSSSYNFIKKKWNSLLYSDNRPFTVSIFAPFSSKPCFRNCELGALSRINVSVHSSASLSGLSDGDNVNAINPDINKGKLLN